MPTCILRGFEIAVTHTSTKLHGGYEQCTRRKTYVSFLATTTTTSTSSVLSYYFLYTTSIPTDKRLKRVEPLSDQVPSYGRHNHTCRQHRRHWQPSWSGKKRCKPGGLQRRSLSNDMRVRKCRDGSQCRRSRTRKSIALRNQVHRDRSWCHGG